MATTTATMVEPAQERQRNDAGDNISAPPPAYEPPPKNEAGQTVMNGGPNEANYGHHDSVQPAAPAPVHMHGEHDMNKGGPQQSSGAMVTPLERLGDHATQVDCPYCKRPTMTRVVENDSTMTIVTGVVLCLICVCLACVPCIAGWFQEIDHFCTQCGKQLTHRPSDGPVQIIAPNNVSQVPSQYHGQSYEMSQQSQMQYSQQHNPEHNPQQNKRQNQQQAYK